MTSLVQAYLYSGKPDEAEAFLKKLSAADTQSALANSLLALVELSDGRAQDAVSDAERAAQEQPKSAANQVLAIANLKAGKLDDALAAAEKGLATEPGNGKLMLLRARILELKGDARGCDRGL